MNRSIVLPTDVKPEKGARRTQLGLPTMRVSRKGKGSSGGSDDGINAYNVTTVDRLVEAFEEKERSLPHHS